MPLNYDSIKVEKGLLKLLQLGGKAVERPGRPKLGGIVGELKSGVEQTLRRLFDELDENGNGRISRRELRDWG